jgi:hypothetical protein
MLVRSETYHTQPCSGLHMLHVSCVWHLRVRLFYVVPGSVFMQLENNCHIDLHTSAQF